MSDAIEFSVPEGVEVIIIDDDDDEQLDGPETMNEVIILDSDDEEGDLDGSPSAGRASKSSTHSRRAPAPAHNSFAVISSAFGQEAAGDRRDAEILARVKQLDIALQFRFFIMLNEHLGFGLDHEYMSLCMSTREVEGADGVRLMRELMSDWYDEDEDEDVEEIENPQPRRNQSPDEADLLMAEVKMLSTIIQWRVFIRLGNDLGYEVEAEDLKPVLKANRMGRGERLALLDLVEYLEKEENEALAADRQLGLTAGEDDEDDEEFLS